MNRLPRAMRKGLRIFALVMAVGAVSALPSDPVEPALSPQERKVLDEYRLHCRPGRFIEEVRANLYSMQQAHPGSTFLKDTAFLAEVHYLDGGFLWNGNGNKPPGWVYSEMFDSIFDDYAPSREAWSRSRIYGNKATGFAGLAILLGVVHVMLGIHSLFNEPPRGQGALVAYRAAQIALPIGWIGSAIYGGICVSRENREFDHAFFESNGKAIAKRLAEDL